MADTYGLIKPIVYDLETVVKVENKRDIEASLVRETTVVTA